MLYNIRYVCSGKYEISRSIEGSCTGCVGGVGTERVRQTVAVSVKSLDHVCHQGRREGTILNKLQEEKYHYHRERERGRERDREGEREKEGG